MMFIIQSLSSGFTTHYLSLYDFRSEYYMPYQFLSHMFLHGDFMHLLFNMLWLVFMGPMVEQYIGDKKFTLLFLVSGLGSALLHIGANYYELSPRSAFRARGRSVLNNRMSARDRDTACTPIVNRPRPVQSYQPDRS